MSGLSDLSTIEVQNQKKDLALESIDNPNDLKFSYNFSFKDTSDLDGSASDSNVGVSNSQLVLTSGSSGTFISKNKVTKSNVSLVQVRVVGEDLGNIALAVSSDNGNNWQTVNYDELTTLTVQSMNLRLRIVFSAATARVDAAVVLYT